MDHKVRTIRLWLATAIVVALGCWEPALWFGVPLFFFPDCACCGPAAPSCFDCSPDYGGDFQATLAGFSNGTGTGCSVFNGTFEILRRASPAECNLQNDDISGVGTIVACASPHFGVIAILTGNSSDGLEVRVQAGSGVDMTEIYYHTSPSDCASYSSESIAFVSSSGGTCCNHGTVELTAI